MLEAIGKWFDSLWKNRKSKVDNLNKEPFFGLHNLREGVKYYLDDDLDKVVILEIDTLRIIGHAGSTDRYGFKYDDLKNMVYFNPGHPGAEIETVTSELWYLKFNRFLSEIGSKYTVVRFKTFTLGIDIPTISLKEATKLIKATKPGTANRWIYEIYLKEVLSDGWIQAVDLNNENSTRIKAWVMDVYRHLKEPIVEFDNYPKFIITEYDKAPRDVMPHQSTRRWVETKELVSASDQWVLRYIPRDIARGKVQYFSMNFIFDAVDLEKVSFDPIHLIENTVQDLQQSLDLKLTGEPPKLKKWDNIEDFESTVDININNLRVVHKELNTSFIDYLRRQKDHHEFRDARPYLNPLARHATINRQMLAFNEKGEFFTRYDYECNGDTAPVDKIPYY